MVSQLGKFNIASVIKIMLQEMTLSTVICGPSACIISSLLWVVLWNSRERKALLYLGNEFWEFMLGKWVGHKKSDLSSYLWWLTALSLSPLGPHLDRLITKPLLWRLWEIQTTQVPRTFTQAPPLTTINNPGWVLSLALSQAISAPLSPKPQLYK